MVEAGGTMPEFDAFGSIAPESMSLASAHGFDKYQYGVSSNLHDLSPKAEHDWDDRRKDRSRPGLRGHGLLWHGANRLSRGIGEHPQPSGKRCGSYHAQTRFNARIAAAASGRKRC